MIAKSCLLALCTVFLIAAGAGFAQDEPPVEDDSVAEAVSGEDAPEAESADDGEDGSDDDADDGEDEPEDGDADDGRKPAGNEAKLWLKVHRLLGRGCEMGLYPEKQACKARGVHLWNIGRPIEVVAVEACRSLGLAKMRILCIEFITDHWGPSGLDEAWSRCHRDHGRLKEIGACLHLAYFGDAGD